jgi:hypothetical protein
LQSPKLALSDERDDDQTFISESDEDKELVRVSLSNLEVKDLVDTGSRSFGCTELPHFVILIEYNRLDPQDPCLKFLIGPNSVSTLRLFIVHFQI